MFKVGPPAPTQNRHFRCTRWSNCCRKAGLAFTPTSALFPLHLLCFFFKSQKGFLKPFPGEFETVWRQSPSQERRPSQASECGMTIAPTAPLPPSTSASSSLQKGVRGGERNPVIPQPPRPRPRQDTSHFTEESSEESWLGVQLELSLSPVSGSYVK